MSSIKICITGCGVKHLFGLAVVNLIRELVRISKILLQPLENADEIAGLIDVKIVHAPLIGCKPTGYNFPFPCFATLLSSSFWREELGLDLFLQPL